MFRRLTAAWPAGLWVIYGYFGWRYRLGTATSPGPGLVPFSIAVLGLVVSVLLLVTHQDETTVRQRTGWRGERRAILFASLMALNVLLTPWIGQILAIGVFTILAARLMGIRKWAGLLALGVGTPAAVYLFFGYILDAPLIEGRILSFLYRFLDV